MILHVPKSVDRIESMQQSSATTTNKNVGMDCGRLSVPLCDYVHGVIPTFYRTICFTFFRSHKCVCKQSWLARKTHDQLFYLRTLVAS